jgi:hypothetical protein
MGEFEATRKNRDEKKEEGSEWHQESRFPAQRGTPSAGRIGDQAQLTAWIGSAQLFERGPGLEEWKQPPS